MKKFLFLIGLFFLSFGYNPYKSFFTSDYDRAITTINQHNYHFHKITSETNISEKLVKSIVFPEMIRYNTFQNFLEETALEMLYIDEGTDAVDFSVGFFQMKPSFIESLEKTIKADTTLKTKYERLYQFKESSASEIRKERLTRLKDVNWQIFYVCALTDYLELKFSNEQLSEKEKVIYFSSAYNYSYSAKTDKIKNWSKVKAFPYGSDYEGKQFTYSEIALHYYTLFK